MIFTNCQHCIACEYSIHYIPNRKGYVTFVRIHFFVSKHFLPCFVGSSEVILKSEVIRGHFGTVRSSSVGVIAMKETHFWRGGNSWEVPNFWTKTWDHKIMIETCL